MKKRFLGYHTTAFISGNESINGMKPFCFDNQSEYILDQVSFTNQRLGKLVEQFVCFQLQSDSKIKLLETNLQINDNKRTVGELDVLFTKDSEPIHLEIIYKFYIYDTLIKHSNPLSYWIGPNRKDTLVYKLDKLKNKQLPLLNNHLTQPYLEKHKLKEEQIKQRIFFKAQLFLPYNSQKINVKPLNKDCIAGFYISFNDILIFEDYYFYVPKKLDWLITPHNNVDWLDYKLATIKLENYIKSKQSPLVWIKDKTNNLKKCFITWW